MSIVSAIPQIDVAAITQAAARHTALRQNWQDRGTAPIGYIKGMAVMYAVVLQKLARGDPAASVMAAAVRRGQDSDALALYAGRFTKLGLRTDVGGTDTLRNLFILLIGLGMRESSGKYYEGRDRSAGNVDAETAEAGLFQMSWNARAASEQISRLFEEYKQDRNGFREIFAEGAGTPSARDLESYGSGSGAEFQKLCKECPGFAVEAAAVALRFQPRHWGPVKRGEVEIRREAFLMLKDVEALVGSSMNAPVYTATAVGVGGVAVKVVQEQLRRLNYPPGEIDGIFGPRTRAALLAFQADNDLATTGVMDEPTLAAFDKAVQRPLDPKRITITPAMLAELGSTTVTNADRTKLVALASSILGALGIGNSAVMQAAGSTTATKTVAATAADASSMSVDGTVLLLKLMNELSNTKFDPNGKALQSLREQIVAMQNSSVKSLTSPDAVQLVELLKKLLPEKTLEGKKALGTLFEQALAVQPNLPPTPIRTPTIFDQLLHVRPDITGPQGVADVVATVASSMVPGFGGALTMLGVGLFAHYFGNQVIGARVQDHANAGNRRMFTSSDTPGGVGRSAR